MTVLLSGSNAAGGVLDPGRACFGITEDSARSVVAAFACPPPTRVHSGW